VSAANRRGAQCIPSTRNKVLPYFESMQPKSILDRVNEIEKYDRLARRNYGLSETTSERLAPRFRLAQGGVRFGKQYCLDNSEVSI
jgi:hypothetical protein